MIAINPALNWLLVDMITDPELRQFESAEKITFNSLFINQRISSQVTFLVTDDLQSKRKSLVLRQYSTLNNTSAWINRVV